MASPQDLEDALIAAHEAGDTEAAQIIAEELKSSAAPRDTTAEFRAAQARNPTDPSLYNKTDALKSFALRALRNDARNIGLTGRTILNTVTSLPLAAMDAGVGVRNFIDEKMRPKQLSDLIAPQQHQGYELPSQTWNKALNDYGVPQHTGILEKGGDIVGQMLLGSKMPAPQIANSAPAGFNPQTMKQVALANAQKEGYVVPPSTVNPSVTNKVLESIGGKVAMEQDASLKNQAVTDALVKRSLGMDDAVQVAEDALPALRAQAAGPYKALRSVGTMRADADYGKALDAITAQYRGAAKDFPDLARTDILDAVESVRKPSFDSDSAMDAIAILRDKASTAYRQGDKALGKAYREISGAMESAIERSLARRGKDATKLLKEFRDARQLIAKSYTAEGALNPQTGSFNAQKLATQLAKGKPLTGDMKKVADFATAFPKAAKLVLDSGSVRNTDVILGAGTAALSREPSYLLYPFARQAVRAGLLTNAGQNALTQPGIQPMPKTALSLLYGTQGLLSE